MMAVITYQKLGSLLWDATLFTGFLYMLLVMHGVLKGSQALKIIKQPATFIRFLIYFGVAIFGILLVMDFTSKV